MDGYLRLLHQHIKFEASSSKCLPTPLPFRLPELPMTDGFRGHFQTRQPLSRYFISTLGWVLFPATRDLISVTDLAPCAAFPLLVDRYFPTHNFIYPTSSPLHSALCLLVTSSASFVTQLVSFITLLTGSVFTFQLDSLGSKLYSYTLSPQYNSCLPHRFRRTPMPAARTLRRHL